MDNYGITSTVLGSIIGILDLIAIFEILMSTHSVCNKLLWALLVMFFPVGGLILYFLLGRQEKQGYTSIA